MRKSIVFWMIGVCIGLMAVVPSASAFTEPSMADYTVSPPFMSTSVPPNIMIILDNSGSMNFNAYGTYPGDYGTVSDEPFTGEPYSGIKTFQITSLQDDAEEYAGAGNVTYYSNSDLDIGSFTVGYNDAIMGLRFQGVAIPQGVTIQSAYIEFTANATNADVTNIRIEGEASDNAAPFELVANNIINRTPTTAVIKWENVPAWTAGNSYPTADITTILQEIVDRPGWAEGNAMVFRFSSWDTTTANKRDARPYDANASTAPKLHVVFSDDPNASRYYGYFSPDHFYTYSSNFNLAYKKVRYDFTTSSWEAETLAGGSATLDNTAIVNQGLWDGNWLNWLCMRRVDVLRKVLMGGLATARTGGGNQTNYGEAPAQTSRVFYKKFDSSSLSAVSPYHGNYSFRMEGGYIYLGTSGTKFSISIQKDVNHEPDSFKDGNLAGVLQRVGDEKARWGNIWFNEGTGSNRSGGSVEHVIGTNMTTMITDLQNTSMDTWTPLAETYYVAMQYFKQEDADTSLDYPNGAAPHSNTGDDPYLNSGQEMACAKSFVLLLTDGLSTKDAMIPSEYKDYDGDGDEQAGCDENNCNYPSGGSDYLDDLALYARTVDLRSATVGKSELDGPQNLILYVVHAFDKDPNASQLLSNAARNGGFDDRNGNNIPDLDIEYDKNGDGIPDTFFEASDGYALEASILNAITDMLKRASSGTAASVLATNSEGEGNMLQAYFQPLVTKDLEDANWFGYLHSLWVDSQGRLFEDSNENLAFDDGDLQITFGLDGDNDTVFIREGLTYKLDEDDPTLRLKTIFEVGRRLSQRDPDDRKIFTYIDADLDGVVDETGADPFDSSGELIAFDTANETTIMPYLGVRDNTTWGDSGANLGSSMAIRADNMVTWVRGTDVDGLRNRTLDGVTWRLGDIIQSTPVTVSRPVERFNLWYADKSYDDFYEAFKDREAVTYVGANDGMLHAFAAWSYNVEDKKYERPSGASASENIGDELWAFIPQSVLPHLKWGAHEKYTHTYLVDAKPRIFDAKILADDAHYADADADENWGTILVMGLRMGAKQITVNEDFQDGLGVVERVFNPSYVCMDITDPRNPSLLWERSYPDQAMSWSTPIPVKVDEQWYLVFGSGPDEYDGTSSQGGYIYVVDMKTGDLLKQFGPFDSNAFFGTAASLDKNLNYNVDAIYISDSYYDKTWQGGLYKIAIPCANCDWDPAYDATQDRGYDTNPDNWKVHKLFDSDRPITAPPSISVELYPDFGVDNVWIYFGTGSYISEADKLSTDQQYLYGIKDPFWNIPMYDGSVLHDYAAASGLTLDRDDLFYGNDITVTTGGRVLKGGALYGDGDFSSLVDEIRGVDTYAGYDGWYRTLDLNGTLASERMISKPAIFGGMSFWPVFTPSSDICANEGTTNFYALYYITGTGFTKQILDIANPDTITFSDNGQTVTEDVVAVKLPTAMIGAPPPSVGLHTGKERGATAYIQLSTGVVELESVGSAIYSLSTITDWWDRTD